MLTVAAAVIAMTVIMRMKPLVGMIVMNSLRTVSLIPRTFRVDRIGES